MSTPKITTVEKLREYLYHAMQIEHATIPPYLLALYSIHPGTNLDASQVIRVVVVEEMLHLTLATNILNAVGGKPDLTAPGFVPLYPAYLPDGETDFQVDLQPFSKDAIKTFLKIERPGKAPDEAKRMVSRHRISAAALGAVPGDTDLQYYSIGEFYEEIVRGLKYLYDKKGSKLFTGAFELQVGSEYYYSGGGKLFPVTDIKSAMAAANLIIEQGEGFDAGIFTETGELAHDFRFEQLQLGRYYAPTDKTPGKPTGPELKVDWDAAYPIKKNARLSDYQDSPELHAAAVAFNQSYADFLAFLTRAYNGEPKLLLEAVPKMFTLRNKITQLIHNPIPGTGENAAPTFEIAGGAAGVAP
jgi:Ferritin-like